MNPTALNVLGLRKDGPQVWMARVAFLAFWAILLAGVNLSVRQLGVFKSADEHVVQGGDEHVVQGDDEYACILVPPPADAEGLRIIQSPLQVGRSVALPTGQVATGSLESGDPVGLRAGYYEAWTFPADEGERIVVAMDSDDVDAYLQILRSDGTEIAFDDDSGDNYNARVEFLAPETGRYTILAASLFEDVTGQYQIRLDRLGDG